VPENEQRNPQTITKKLKYEKEKNRSNTGTYAISKTLLRGGGEGEDTFIAQKIAVSALRHEAGTEPTTRFMFMSLSKQRKQYRNIF
jgi:hypothetical protein